MLRTLIAVATLLVSSLTSAQNYPSRPIRMIVASTPGSGVDIVARMMATRMSETLKSTLVVDNRAGAGGTIGCRITAKSPPDGYTILMAAPSLTINALLVKPAPYDAVRDFSAIVDLIGGQVQVMFANVVAVLGHMRSGKLRALATTGTKRASATPDLPTVAESGVPAYVVTSWLGLLAPARTAQPQIVKLNAALTDRDTIERLAAEGGEPAPGTPDAFARHVASELSIWGKVMKASGL